MMDRLDRNDERAPNERPVAVVAPHFMSVGSGSRAGTVPLFASARWDDRPQPGIERAVIVLHGRLRNADAYFALGQRACGQAGCEPDATLLLAPQFLAEADVAAHNLSASTLRWEWTDWMGGGAALAPAPVSSFDVLDELLRTLADPHRFPALTDVVIAGHSGGAQVVQRYAVVSRGDAALVARRVALRYVIANPSSYLYFDTQRPLANGGFAPYDAARCASFNRWKYGLDALPAYAAHDGVVPTPSALEAAYAQRDVVILLGGDDCDPHHPALDRSCAALAQGEHRLARGRAYVRYIAGRQRGALNHRLVEIPGVGHDAAGIFGSAAGLRALFGASGTC